ncbi:flavin reductase family protein [Trichococcus ilyis]|jgi:flavin reductase (DIM6/NTAB) family NADH-FMN oxidoreductase RutF|uniref:NADH-FMN oxidoreductase RutF, flavin reductase (DIM6/NTAB) family n=1 Tax=Trichococcus ilyis TaxID=640938 RepID=A0A143YX34_9LACT|nr:flavin reductase family protein [Trichococcus ilyis]CZR00765.1 Hypothetical protein TR210_1764 [Trichococcus ilyis]SEJ37374.1 NADH-FMN oxidoreductase RutF, flavin reductase (DIM6/NTAB) family [Trichococcus ilyis]
MQHFSSNDISTKQMYKFLTGSIIPRPIAWITTENPETQVVNAAPFSFFSVASNVLPLISVAILRNGGKMKDSAKNLLANKQAVVHIVSEELVEEMNRTAAQLPDTESEIELTELTLTASRSVTVPAIREAKIRMETSVHQYVPIADAEGAVLTDLFILRVEDFHFDEAVFDPEKQYVLADKLQPVARLAGNEYTKLGEIFSVERP